jgi:chromate transporter
VLACAGTLGGLLTTWVTFVPCFLWIFLGAPFVETLRGNRALSAALATITAAVVGVIRSWPPRPGSACCTTS